ncbi:hypothetical protein [Cetobacterium sp.]
MSLIDCIIDESNIYRAIHTLKSSNREDYYKDNENYVRILKTISKYK